ncbi:hypothetical protein [Flavobacterium lacus]|uniref:Uncharacterized protein n=1 Tax=Flavobacterium lacus TaxID=1353778 RepID=A0A328X0W1_9FLAO|nr:hypothetical protein [Flavobacterium lacus]RAR51046.1 hypothetical protein B0I10_101219 [Flavobacterium lacus]
MDWQVIPSKNNFEILNLVIFFCEHSNFSIAKTILHECIHAYLNIKKIDSNLGTTIAELSGLDLGQLLGSLKGGFGGAPIANGMLIQQAYDGVLDLINDIRIAIQNNPNVPINQLNF